MPPKKASTTESSSKPIKPRIKQPKKVVKKSIKSKRKLSKTKQISRPYIIFCDEKREYIKSNLKQGENVTIKLKELWTSMTNDEKQVYTNEYIKRKDVLIQEEHDLLEKAKINLQNARKKAKDARDARDVANH